ncbi:MAG: hypothetical protein HY062_09325 [Bacteroidetes bacterium]|nr:hypothetical protein [Bacteroidota bacterium]
MKNGNTIYLALTKNRFIYTYINMEDCRIEFEKTYLTQNWKIPIEYDTSSMLFGMLTDNKENIYFTIENITQETTNPDNPKLTITQNYLGIIKLNLRGDFIWSNTISREVPKYNRFPIYYFSFIQKSYEEKNYSMFHDANNIYIITKEDLKSEKSSYKTGFPSNVVLHKIDQNGNLNRSIINVNKKESGIIPSNSTLIFENGEILFNIISPNKIKFVTLKL